MPAISDRAAIRRLLETDRRWAIYALGDLSPRLFDHCSWYCAADGEPAVALLVRAFATPVLFTLGEASAVRGVLDEMELPPRFYLHIRPEVVPLIEERCAVTQEKSMWRMVLDEKNFQPTLMDQVARLGSADLAALQRLYADGDSAGEAPDFFVPSMLDDGAFFGVWKGRELAAAAGTHLVVPAEGIAAVGNIYTRRDSRGQGLATLVTSAVTVELLRRKLPTIALNVEQRNAAAIRVYERLGFVRYCAFNEGLAVCREG
jgi:ribosomal protein S18 acetylase RimI-like enzyme